MNYYMEPLNTPLIDRIRFQFNGTNVEFEKRYAGFRFGPWSTWLCDTLGMDGVE